MLVTGTIKCLHCGHVSGTWVGARGAPLTWAGFKGATAGAPTPLAPMHCLRCHGSVFLDGPSAVRTPTRLRRIQRLRRQIAAFDEEAGRAA